MAKRKPTRKENLVTILSSISDPRVDRTKAHKLCDILTMGLCGMLCGHSDFTVMAEFAKARKTWFESYGEWEGLESIAAVECERTVGGETTNFRRYFITSLGPDAELIATSVREHWGIENSLHWVLDMVWREDESRARAGNATQNLPPMRRLAHNLIKTEDPDSKKSVRMRTKIANWDTDYLLKLIGVKLDA